MKLVILSDTHSFHDRVELPEGDILIHGGDFSFTGAPIELERFNEWLGKQDFKYKICIYGNHELTLDPKKNFDYQLYRDILTEGIWLNQSGCTIEGLRFWGSPATPEFMNWGFNYDRDEIHEIWDQIPPCDVLITHGPPFGTLDQSSRNGEHLGDKALLEAIKRVKPQLSIHGHIHGGYGRMDDFTLCDHKIIILNASICSEEYKPVNKPFVVDL